MSTSRIIVIVLLAFGVIAVTAHAAQSEHILLITQPVDHDVYAAHREVNVQSTINGDLVTVGRRVRIEGKVIGDVIVAAQNIEVRSEVGDDLRAAGQHIRVISPVLGHVVAAGQTVTIEQPVSDWAWLAGETVDVRGNIGGNLKIRASKITLGAEVVGDVDLIGDQLFIGPEVVIRGDLRWRSGNEAEISSAAIIEGDVITEPLPGLTEKLRMGSTYSLPLNAIVAVMVLFLLFSRPLQVSAKRVSTRPVRSLLLGLAIFLIAPSLIVLLFLTGVGVWLGMAALFIFLLILLLGVLTGLFSISDVALRKLTPQPVSWQSLASIFVTVVVVGLLIKIPWLGIFIMISTWLIGLGALCWNAWSTLRHVRYHELQKP